MACHKQTCATMAAIVQNSRQQPVKVSGPKGAISPILASRLSAASISAIVYRCARCPVLISRCVQSRNDHLGGLSRRCKGDLLRERAGGGGGSAGGGGRPGDARGGLTGDLTGERLPEDCRRMGLLLGPGERLFLPRGCEGDLLKRRLRGSCRPGDRLSLLQRAEIGG